MSIIQPPRSSGLLAVPLCRSSVTERRSGPDQNGNKQNMYMATEGCGQGGQFVQGEECTRASEAHLVRHLGMTTQRFSLHTVRDKLLQHCHSELAGCG